MDQPAPEDFLAIHRRRQRRLIAGAVLGGAMLVGGVVVLVTTYAPAAAPAADARLPAPAPAPAPAAEVPATPKLSPLEHARVMARAELEGGCDPAAAERTLAGLAERKDWEGVVLIGREWEGLCPADHEVRWKLYKALEELERWPEAAAVATQLITARPTDVDYWWWRGQARKHTGDLAGAAADFQQSIALSELATSNGIHVRGLITVAPEAGRPCDAAFALRWLDNRSDDGVNSNSRELLLKLWATHHCHDVIGHGETKLSLDPRSRARAKIGGASVTGRVDLHAPYVVIDAADAAKAKLDLTPATAVDLVVDGKVVAAHLLRAKVTLGKLRADDVEVAVVDQLDQPRIGLSFLWRFDVQVAEDGRSAAVSDPNMP